MGEIKTKPTKESVETYINKLTDEKKKKDALELLKLYKSITKKKPVLWGNAIIGFGQFHYKSERSKQEGDWMLAGFSPRKQNLSLHLMSGMEKSKTLFSKLGKHKTGIGCVYINKLEDIDMKILEKIIRTSWETVCKKYK